MTTARRAMCLRTLAACVAVAVTVITGAAAEDSRTAPRFSFGVTKATANEDVALRVEKSPRLGRRKIRLYLVPAGVAHFVRSRFDPRLSFIGFVRSSPRSRLVFTVPPLGPGSYALAYWCRGCLAHGKRIGVQASPKLRVNAPAREECPTTKPNHFRGGPRTVGSVVRWHGNGALWVALRRDGTLVTNAVGFSKQPSVGKEAVVGLPYPDLGVRYRRLDPPSPALTAQTVHGTLNGYDGPSWAARLHLEPGCWQITGRIRDLSLSFVAQVVLGPG